MKARFHWSSHVETPKCLKNGSIRTFIQQCFIPFIMNWLRRAYKYQRRGFIVKDERKLLFEMEIQALLESASKNKRDRDWELIKHLLNNRSALHYDNSQIPSSNITIGIEFPNFSSLSSFFLWVSLSLVGWKALNTYLNPSWSFCYVRK